MMCERSSAKPKGPARPGRVAALLGIALLLAGAGCAIDRTAELESAYEDWIAFAADHPKGDTAAERDERADKLKAEANRLLGGEVPAGLDGEAAFYAGSLLHAAGRDSEAAPLLERAIDGLEGGQVDLARMTTAGALLALGEPDRAREQLMEVSDRTVMPGVTADFNHLVFDLVEIYEDQRRWSDALPLLKLVRDSGDEQLGPVAARWIAYVHRDAGDERAAETAARDAMGRFPDDENLEMRMTNFLHQHTLEENMLPDLPPLTWIGDGMEGTDLAAMMKGKVTLIDVWAPWCPPCRRSFPFLRELREEYGDLGFQVVGLTRFYGYYEDEENRVPDTAPERELELIESFAAAHQLDWPVGVAAEGDELFSSLGVAGIPNFILVDRKGAVRGTFLGETAPTRARIEELAVDLLNVP